MQTFVDIPSVNLSSERVTELSRIVPEGRRSKYYFGCRLPHQDARCKQLLSKLAEWGMEPYTGFQAFDDSRHFIFRLVREYSSDDLLACPLVELRPASVSHIEATPRRGDGLFGLPREGLNERMNVMFCATGGLFVPSRIKRLLEASSLLAVVFRPTHLLPGRRADLTTQVIPWAQIGEPWWEIDSNATMPPLSPSVTLVDKRGRPVESGDFSDGVHRRENMYSHVELRYRAADIDRLAPFDLARTYEPFGNRSGYNRDDCSFVVSSLMYRLCLEHSISADWVPIRVE